MENGKKITYIAAILGLILLIILFVWFAFGRNKVVSPVPDEGIKVIFTSSVPSPSNELTPTPTATSSPTPTATAKATPKPTATPKPSAIPSSSPTISPSPTP